MRPYSEARAKSIVCKHPSGTLMNFWLASINFTPQTNSSGVTLDVLYNRGYNQGQVVTLKFANTR